ncbi:DUF1090 domain-containing protein [Neisseria sp. Ec49-e6-T10]|uniref:DUF1090 domain-containing protein n=1 Tax=Neisseria sp. Ec49-e6-T10 TaxID=3140744 RepID=UPI003EC08830
MNTKSKFILSIIALSLSMTVSAKGLSCAEKQKAIETEISYAKTHNNTYRIAGLNKALADVKAYCTDEGLKAKRQEKVKEKEFKVSKAERELKEAKARGDAQKIAKRERKLQKALTELAEAKARV